MRCSLKVCQEQFVKILQIFLKYRAYHLCWKYLDLTPHLPLCIIGGPTTTCIVMVTTGMVNPHLKSGSTYKHMHKTEVVLLKTPPHFHLRNLSLTTGICLVDINYVVCGCAVLQLLPANGEFTYPVLQQTSISRLGLGLGLRLVITNVCSLSGIIPGLSVTILGGEVHSIPLT